MFYTLFYQPCYNALIYIYSLVGDFGLAIIAFTILIKLLLYPLSQKQITSQKAMMALQPEIKKLQKKYKDDRQKLSQEQLALYKEHGINPAAGCLPLILQLVIFFAMYRVIDNIARRDAFAVHAEDLYQGLQGVAATVHQYAFGVLNLGQPHIPLAIVTAVAQWWQIKTMTARAQKDRAAQKEEKSKDAAQENMAEIMQKQMVVILPLMTLIIGVTFPSGLILYWLTSTLFMILQQQIAKPETA